MVALKVSGPSITYLLANFAIRCARYLVVQRVALLLAKVRPGTIVALFKIIFTMSFEVQWIDSEGNLSKKFCTGA